jgi:hypothetical protein
MFKGWAADGPASRLRSTLVIVECALAVTLLVGAGLLIRSLLLVRAVPVDSTRRTSARARLANPGLAGGAGRNGRRWPAHVPTGGVARVRSAGAITNLMTLINRKRPSPLKDGRPASTSKTASSSTRKM